ncbi:MAG: hypothetical protein ABI277_16655, partial [Burkholderiaceae bacterium]
MNDLLMEERPLRVLQDGGRYRTPGVYYEEGISASDVPDEPTGVPAFVGWCESVDSASAPVLRFSRWSQFEAWGGPGRCPGFLADVVRGFFVNGGTRCVVVPVPHGDRPADRAGALIRPFAAGGVLEDVEDIDLVCVADAMHD